MLLPETADDADIAAFEQDLGLDRPLVIQYASWLARIVFEGGFGVSWVAKVPASDLIGVALWPTLKLAIAAQIIATIFAIPLGMASAVKRYSIIDNITTFIVLVGQAMPLFWLGIMLMIVFGVWLRWLPTSGSDTWVHLIATHQRSGLLDADLRRAPLLRQAQGPGTGGRRRRGAAAAVRALEEMMPL